MSPNIEQTTLRPGLLVSLKTSIRGNVHYTRRDLENDKERSVWETTKTTTDADEMERAVKARTVARGLVSRVCSVTEFGLLCPQANADKLEEAIRDARAVANEFNSTSNVTRLRVYVICGRVAANDAEALKSINSEVSDLMDTMARGVEQMDVKSVRDAAMKAKQISQMLTPKAEASVQLAVEAARNSATAINKAIKAGEEAALEIDKLAIRKITEQRSAFLDFSEEADVAPIPKGKARRLDLDPDAAKASADYIADQKRQRAAYAEE